MTNAELLDLLIRARNALSHGCWNGSCCDVRARIDAALPSLQAAWTEDAERQDSATEVVEWKRGLYAWDATIGNMCLHIKATWDKGALHKEQWNWRVERQGKCATEAEAKAAAIAAARGMK
jgi:hypothetical protein